MSLQQLLLSLLTNWPAFALLLGILVLFKFLGSASFKGWSGERMVRRGLNRLDPQRYRQFHDLYLPRPDGQGTTQLDHVIEGHSAPLLDPEAVRIAISRLELLCQSTDRKAAARNHLKALKARNA